MHSSYFSNSGVSGCKTTSNALCENSQHNTLSIGTTHTISHVDFILTSSYSGSGGAIYLNGESKKATTSLSLNKCTFTSIQCTGQGGAIYVTSVSSLEILSSILISCSTTYRSDLGGGGMFLSSIDKTFISSSSLIDCSSPDDAGGAMLSDCKAPILASGYAVDSCRFITCKTQVSSGSAGGGLRISNSEVTIGCRNCLFRSCEAGHPSGGFLFDLNHKTLSKPISFSFFKNNYSPAGYGEDGYFRNCIPQPFLYSFSFEGGSTRVHFEDMDAGPNDWLPLGTLSYLSMPERNCYVNALMNSY